MKNLARVQMPLAPIPTFPQRGKEKCKIHSCMPACYMGFRCFYILNPCKSPASSYQINSLAFEFRFWHDMRALIRCVRIGRSPKP